MRRSLSRLLIAIVLVLLVVYLFLQDWRATLNPDAGRARLAGGHVHSLPAVRLLYQYAFDVRNVLAIGLVVDDAIVVVEAYNVTLRRVCVPRMRLEEQWKSCPGPVICIALFWIGGLRADRLYPRITEGSTSNCP